MRINKYIAQNSNYSRRKADELIEQSRVEINNTIITTPGHIVDPEKDTIKIDGETIRFDKYQKAYYKFYKPKGVVCSLNDDQGRRDISDIIPQNQNLKPVGRLDKDSEGLLLLSNDGDFIYSHTHPKHNFEKEYIVELYGTPTTQQIKTLEKGIMLDGYKLRPCKIIPSENKFRVILTEGRNRQIRKMFEFTKTPVKYLQRIRIGDIHLSDLQPGEVRKLTKTELNVY